jgi:hypothetical protein
MFCYFCEQTSPEGSLFCKPCGSPFHLAPCPRCAAVNALTVVSCYKCKAILPIRRAETKELATNDTSAEPAIAHAIHEAANEAASEAPALKVAATNELAQPAPTQELQETHVARVEEMPAVNSALPTDVDGNGYQKTIKLDRPPVEVHDENYQKTIALQRAPMEVHDVVYQKTIPVRRPLEKVHDEDYQKTIALQRSAIPADAPERAPVGAYDVNYQKTIALQRAPIEAHDEAYVKTISTRHPPTSLVGGADRQVAANEANSLANPLSAMPADLQAEYAALQSIDLVQKAKWGQRALMASAALLLIVTGAYFFLRSERSAVAPVSIEAETLEKLPATVPSKVLEPLPLNVKVDAANRVADKVPPRIDSQSRPVAPALTPPPSSPSKAVAAAKPSVPANQQSKAVPNDRLLLMPPDAAKLSAAATAAAIAAALGKDTSAQSANKSDATKLKPEVQAPAPARAASTPAPQNNPQTSDTTKDSVSPSATSQAPAPCTEALAALGLCVLQPATPKP